MLSNNEELIKPNMLNLESKITFDLLGILIATQPGALLRLLARYHRKVASSQSGKEILGATLDAIEEDSGTFKYELAELLVDVIPILTSKGSKHENLNFAGNSDVNIGLDPVSAVAGAVGSIANLLGHSKQKRLLKQQAQAQTLSRIISYKTEQQRLRRARQKPSQTSFGNTNWLKLAGVITVLGILFWWLFGR